MNPFDLEAPELDDRRFQDIVDEAKRMIPRFTPEWTNHNVADPGVTLIELFAWMTEMTIYRLNQVPERYYAKFLELVGIQPFAPSVARTEVTFWLSAAVDERVTVPSGTAVATAGGDDRVVFTTTESLEITQPGLLAALVAESATPARLVDVWDDLRYDSRAVRCFPSTPLAPGDAMYFGFDASLAGNVLQVDVSASVEGIGVDPNNPPVAWQVWTGEVWIDCDVLSDSTGGLNRDGRVQLVVPMAHEPLTLGTARHHWLRIVLTAPTLGQPIYQQSPQLRSLSVVSVGGTVVAEHSAVHEAEELGRSDGTSGQSFRFADAPVLSLRGTEVLEVVDRDVVTRWDRVADFSASGPADTHFVLDEITGTVHFGPRIRYADGSIRQHGAAPADGAAVRIAGYRTGGGAAGNVGADTLTSVLTTIPYVTRVSNRRAAFGGVDAETVANAKRRGPMSLRTGHRAVTAGDYSRLAREASSEVARARTLPPLEPGGPVRVLIVPNPGPADGQRNLDDFALANELIGDVGAYLDERRVLGTSVEIATPYYQGVTVAALIDAVPGSIPDLVRDRVLTRLYRLIDPITGGPDGNGWPFDTDLNAVALSEIVQAIDGVDRVQDLLLFEFDLRTGERHGDGRQLIRLDARSLFLSARHQVVVR